MELNPDIAMLFDRVPGTLPLYEVVERAILDEFEGVRVKVSKTQVSFSNRYGFAVVWPPLRRVKGRPGVYVVLTFGLGRRVEHPRIVESVEPYPGRWTHHTLVEKPEEVDELVRGWLREAYAFSAAKGRGR